MAAPLRRSEDEEEEAVQAVYRAARLAPEDSPDDTQDTARSAQTAARSATAPEEDVAPLRRQTEGEEQEEELQRTAAPQRRALPSEDVGAGKMPEKPFSQSGLALAQARHDLTPAQTSPAAPRPAPSGLAAAEAHADAAARDIAPAAPATPAAAPAASVSPTIPTAGADHGPAQVTAPDAVSGDGYPVPEAIAAAPDTEGAPAPTEHPRFEAISLPLPVVPAPGQAPERPQVVIDQIDVVIAEPQARRSEGHRGSGGSSALLARRWIRR